MARLPLSPSEAFVLSQLDGATDLEELASVTNLGERELERTLDRLATLRIIERGGAHPTSEHRPLDPRRDDDDPVVEPHVRPTPAAPASGRARSVPPKKTETVRAPAAGASPAEARTRATVRTAPARRASLPPEKPSRSRTAAPPKQASIPPKRTSPPRAPSTASRKAPVAPRKTSTPPKPEAPAAKPPSLPPKASDVIDIAVERRRQIDDMHARLDDQTHYQLLGVEAGATPKEIKNAYFRLVMIFHPDKYFGKQLGPYKARVEQVCARLTLTHEVLSSPVRRQEYDGYLATQQATRALEAALDSTQSPPASVAAAAAEPTPSQRPVSASSRRRLFAARLGRAAPDKPATSPDTGISVPSTTGPSAPRAAEPMADLRRLLQSGRNVVSPRPLEPYRAAAEKAFAEQSWVSAVNAARIALSLAPADDSLRVLLETASSKAAAELAACYKSRASYEENNNNWEAAARSYERVAEGTPGDATPLLKAAECLLRAGTDPRGAVRAARGAVALAPNVASHRLTLAKGYEAAGLVESALGELDRALKLSPEDATIGPWMARLRSVRR